MMKQFPKNIKAQSTVEFTFGVVVVAFLIYGMVMIFRWAGMDLASRRMWQDNSLINSTDPLNQLNAEDDQVMPMASVYHGLLTNGSGN